MSDLPRAQRFAEPALHDERLRLAGEQRHGLR
jgi:hypothetical protein